MKSKISHTNINVIDLDRSLNFYQKALGLHEKRRKSGNGFTLLFLADDDSTHEIELTYLADRNEPYNLGDNENHIAFWVEDFDAARKLHEEMNCICYDNPEMGIYFIEDPDGYWLEIMPLNRT
jgi:lactoylglutathione lyase